MSILNTLKNAVTSQAAEKVFLLQKNSPKLLFAVGTAGVIGTVVLACRATLNLQPILDEHADNVKDMLTDLEKSNISQDEYDKHVRNDRLHTFGKVLKLYAVPVGVGALSIGALTGSHIVLNRQNAAALAGWKAVEKGYQQYRERVRADVGEEKDREYANGYKTEEVSETLADGSVKTTTKKVINDPSGLSPYSEIFSEETSRFFSRSAHENEMTLTMKQNWANDKLHAKGFLFLNDVREMLGMDPVPEGQMVGWLYNHAEAKDGFVSFGIFDGDSEEAERFLNGRSPYVTLDFNVDGQIWDKIGRRNPKL